jgi:hypothetical protein
MGRLSASQALRQAEALLKEWLDGNARFERSRTTGPDDGVDLVVRLGRTALVVQVKLASDSRSIASSIEHARRVAPRFGKEAVPIVVVPFMGELGQRLSAQWGVSWFDLSGNARVLAPGLRIHIEGKPNRFKRVGRPSTVFAPRSSRITRQLLIEADRSFQQRELSRLTGLNEGFTSRIVRKLEADELILRDKSGAVRARDPGLLLDAWQEAYDFGKHHVIRGHVASRSSEQGQARLIEVLKKKKLRCAATGLGAAWLLTKFAAFRLVTVFVNEEPDDRLLEAAGFRAEERGANTWIVVPNDLGVFAGAAERDGIPCVHPVQAYVDLKAHPERANEAAQELRKQLLSWGR